MGQLFRDIKKYYNYALYAASADLRSEVTSSYLDWFWWILEPVCNMFIYYFIFGFVFKSTEQYFLVFIFSGITMWNFFNKTITTSVRLIKESKATITRVYIPKQILLIEKMLVNAFKMLISSAIVVTLMIPYQVPVDFRVLEVIPVLITFFIFTYGCGCILMHFGVYIDDLSYIVSILLNMLFYFTGIFYSIMNKFPDPLGLIFERVNPIAFFISAMRYPLLYQTHVPILTLFVWLLFSIILAYVGTKMIYRNENSYVKVI